MGYADYVKYLNMDDDSLRGIVLSMEDDWFNRQLYHRKIRRPYQLTAPSEPRRFVEDQVEVDLDMNGNLSEVIARLEALREEVGDVKIHSSSSYSRYDYERVTEYYYITMRPNPMYDRYLEKMAEYEEEVASFSAKMQEFLDARDAFYADTSGRVEVLEQRKQKLERKLPKARAFFDPTTITKDIVRMDSIAIQRLRESVGLEIYLRMTNMALEAYRDGWMPTPK